MWGVGPGFAGLGFRVSVSGLQALSHGVGWVSSYVLCTCTCIKVGCAHKRERERERQRASERERERERTRDRTII